MASVLICVPQRPTAPYVDLSTQVAINALRWHGRMDVLYLGGVSGKPHPIDLAEKLTRARHVALMCNYDALLIVEADMIPPPDALERLAEGDYDIAYGTYCSRRDGKTWLVTKSVEQLGQLEYFPDEVLRGGGWLETQGIGTGCTLIKRDALEQVAFRGDEWSPDWHLARDAVSLGIKQAHNLDVQCGHRIDAQTVAYPTGLVTYPQAWRLTGQYRVREDRHIGFSDGSSAHGGDTVSLDDDLAVAMFRNGTIEEI